VPARKSPPHPHDTPRPLQRRVDLAAKRSRNRRFHARYDRLIRPDVWWRAWEEGRANGGSAGVDGVGIAEVERGGVQGCLDELAADLQARRYRPQPVRRVYMPKPDGRQRPLGMPMCRAYCTSVQGTWDSRVGVGPTSDPTP
jgi:RNA-directed DNA polymerase